MMADLEIVISDQLYIDSLILHRKKTAVAIEWRKM